MTAKRSILIVEDDAEVRAILSDHLAVEHGFVIFTAGTLDEAEAIIAEDNRAFDAVLLDIGLPDGDGRDFCAKLRQQGHAIPILMLTGRDGEADIVSGLDCGANDYVAKPFRLNELLARLRAQMRMFDSRDEVVFSIGPYTFHPAKKLLSNPIKKRRIWLTAKEVAILKVLCRSDGRPVDREILLRGVWGHDAAASTHMLETHIYRLRRKIEPDPRDPALLLTVHGAYRLNLPMEAAD
ncbi:MAG TPA: response regulator transcription factor [Acetobacteraceae bacterium]|nr:response regulator transcription factor [Acetobacteraceae bacterium]